MKIDNHINGLPTWLDNFSSLFKKAEETKIIKTAATDVKSLPKVSWKGETYYVSLGPEGAMLYNKFGNEHLLLDHVTSVEEAQKELNEGSVSAEIEVATPEANPESVVTAGANAKQQERIAAICDGEESDEEAIMLDEDDELFDVFAAVDNDDTADNDEINIDDNANTKEVVDKPAPKVGPEDGVIKYGFNEIRADINNLRRQIEALSAQQYAHYDVAPNLDIGTAEAEVQHFNEAAMNSQKVIDAEHAVDISTQAGRAILNYKFLDELFGDEPEIKQEIIDNIESQLNNQTQNQVESVNPANENIPQNINTELDTDQDDIEIIDENIDPVEDFDISVQDMPNMPNMSDNENDVIEDSDNLLTDDINTLSDMNFDEFDEFDETDESGEFGESDDAEESEDIEIIEEDEESDDESEEESEDIITDEDDIAKISDEHICPFCDGELEIQDYDEDDEYCIINCTECDKQYKVHAETGKIYIINNSDGEDDEE